MAALFKAISSSIKAYQGPLISTLQLHFCGPGKDYRLNFRLSAGAGKPAEERAIAKSQRGPSWSQGQ